MVLCFFRLVCSFFESVIDVNFEFYELVIMFQYDIGIVVELFFVIFSDKSFMGDVYCD